MFKLFFAIFISISSSYASITDDIEYSGQLNFGYRQFQVDNNDDNNDYQLMLEGKFSLNYEGEDSQTYISVFGREDKDDKTRNIVNIDEAYYKYILDTWSFSLGNHIFNWSVLEMFHPVDSINARNLDANADRIERLGQPAFVITKEFESSILQVITFLQTISPIVPSVFNRNGPQVRLDAPRFVEDDDTYTNDPNMTEVVLHYLHNFETFDLDLHAARKYDTLNPVIGRTYPSIEEIRATPFYLPVTQFGVAIQGTYDVLIYKIEHIQYDFDNYQVCTFVNCVNQFSTLIDHSLTAFGLEYSKAYQNDHEGMYFLEYQTILGTTIEQARTINAFQRDLGIGYRHNFNNFDGHEIIAVVIKDMDQYHEQVYSFSHSFRLGESWKWHTELRIVEAEIPSDELELDNFSGLKPIAESDNIFFKLTRLF